MISLSAIGDAELRGKNSRVAIRRALVPVEGKLVATEPKANRGRS